MPLATLPLDIRPVTPIRWPDLAALFQRRGGPKYCWCSVWRDLTAGQRRTAAAKRAALNDRVSRGEHVGLLGYLNDDPVAWCSVGPRHTYRALGGQAYPDNQACPATTAASDGGPAPGSPDTDSTDTGRTNPGSTNPSAADPDSDIWSLVCFFVHREARGFGVAAQLLDAALAAATAAGAHTLEAYPVDPDSPSYRFMGRRPIFLDAGFHDIGPAGTRRHVMRRSLHNT